MRRHIYFVDKSNALQGPHTERQVHGWYRDKWFDSSTVFYRTRSNEGPEEGEGITLGTILSQNGSGCPFLPIDDSTVSKFEQKRNNREEALQLIDQKLVDSQEKCDYLLSLEQTVVMAEKDVENLIAARLVTELEKVSLENPQEDEEYLTAEEETEVEEQDKKTKKKKRNKDTESAQLSIVENEYLSAQEGSFKEESEEKRTEEADKVLIAEHEVVEAREEVQEKKNKKKKNNKKKRKDAVQNDATSQETGRERNEATQDSWKTPIDPTSILTDTFVARHAQFPKSLWDMFYQIWKKTANQVLMDLYAAEISNRDDRNYILLTRANSSDVRMFMSSILPRMTCNDGRLAIGEYILVERLMRKQYFACVSCQESYFNYKQALIHFMSDDHLKKDAGFEFYHAYHILVNSFPGLLKFLKTDEQIENARLKKYGRIDKNDPSVLYPTKEFHNYILVAYEIPLLAEIEHAFPSPQFADFPRYCTGFAAGEKGLKAMEELHDHLGQGPTECRTCGVKTGDRDGFYAHYLSYRHVHNMNMRNLGSYTAVDFVTYIVNMHKKDRVPNSWKERLANPPNRCCGFPH